VSEAIPVISVVMAVYNGEKYLAEAIESVLAQTYQDFEFIIVDDSSTDSTASIIHQIMRTDRRVKTIKNEENVGLGVSLRIGIQKALGIYIARMDADDISQSDRLENQLKFLDSHPEIMVLGGDHIFIDSNGKLTGTLTYPKNPEVVRWNMLLGSGMIVSNGAAMFRRQFFDRVGQYSDLRAAQDFELWTRMVGLDPLPIANLDSVIYYYRQHGTTTTKSQNTLQEHNAVEIRLRKIEEFLGKPVPAEVVLAYRYPSYTYKNIDLCIKTWIEIYIKFIQKFKVDSEARREIQIELISRLNKYSYIPPQKNNIQYRVSLWKLISWLPMDLSLRLILFKIEWIFKRL